METIAELVPQIVLWVFAPLLVFCLAGWVLLQLPSFKSQKWSKLGKSVCAGLVALAIACTALSDKNTNGVNGVGGLYLMQFNPPVVQSVTPEDISNGWCVAEVSDAGTFAPPPANAVTNERWRLRGAYDDAFRIPANGWSYPFASGVMVLSRGEIRRNIRSCDFPRAFEQDLSQLPVSRRPLLPEGRRESVFWYGATSSNTLLVTWWDFALGRCAANPVRFQSELFLNGGFDYRYEDRTVRHIRVWPFDWDDDGLENSVDPDPLVAGPDAHGTNAEWYNTVCSNVLEAVASGSTGTTGILPVGNGDTGTTGILPVGGDCVLSWRADVNSNAYYFVDVVAERGPTPIYFTGDRDSRLGNPVVVALAGVTNRVPLLIGVDYAVTSDTPFTVSFPMDYVHPTVTTNGIVDYNVRWPLNFVFTESVDASNRVYTVTVEPYDPGGVLTWESVGIRSGASSGCGCGCLSCVGFSIGFNCSATCACHGECHAVGGYAFENAHFTVMGGECRCGFDDPPPDSPPSPHEPNDPPSLTITFSKPAVIFEDSFLEKPGVRMPRRSTRVRLTIDAYGGSGGGTFSVTGVKMSKLFAIGRNVVLPYGDELPPGGSYHATGVYEGVEGSDELNDVEVQGILVPNYYPYNTSTSTATLTSVKVALTAEFAARDNPCQTRHTYGVGERVKFTATPALAAGNFHAVKTDSGDLGTPYDTFRGGDISNNGESNVDTSQARTYICPASASKPNITVILSGVEYRPVMSIVEPSEVISPSAIGTGSFIPSQVAVGRLIVENYIGPFHVSFQGVKVAEIPCEEPIPPTGYYATSDYTGQLTHTYRAVAGGMISVTNDNFWCHDRAGYDFPVNNWSAGTLVWKVPIGWKRLLYENYPANTTTVCDYERHLDTTSRPLLIGGRTDAYVETFRIDADGTMSVEKFGWRLIRTRWSVSGTVERIE